LKLIILGVFNVKSKLLLDVSRFDM